MNHFMDELKTRMDDAQRRLQEAATQLTLAQNRHQTIAQEFGSLQFLFQAELRKEQRNAVLQQHQASGAGAVRAIVNPPIQNQERAEVNKTEIVREILQQHPNGMTPNELWKLVSSQMPYRPYLYSILKRLKDKGDAFQRRGKYFSKMLSKSEEGKESSSMVQ